MENILFYLGLTFLIIHEMDAIRCKEWRILPLLSLLDGKNGQTVFLFMHIPLFVWIFYSLPPHPGSDFFMVAFDIFMIIHIGLHLLLLRNKKNEFKDWISWVLIVGAGVFGGLHLWVGT